MVGGLWNHNARTKNFELCGLPDDILWEKIRVLISRPSLCILDFSPHHESFPAKSHYVSKYFYGHWSNFAIFVPRKIFVGTRDGVKEQNISFPLRWYLRADRGIKSVRNAIEDSIEFCFICVDILFQSRKAETGENDHGSNLADSSEKSSSSAKKWWNDKAGKASSHEIELNRHRPSYGSGNLYHIKLYFSANSFHNREKAFYFSRVGIWWQTNKHIFGRVYNVFGIWYSRIYS